MSVLLILLKLRIVTECLGTQVKMNDNSFLEVILQLADGNSRFGSRFRNKRGIWNVWGWLKNEKSIWKEAGRTKDRKDKIMPTNTNLSCTRPKAQPIVWDQGVGECRLLLSVNVIRIEISEWSWAESQSWHEWSNLCRFSDWEPFWPLVSILSEKGLYNPAAASFHLCWC